ncbi:putative T-cell immunomodulatory protein [Neospora caninum Liverpool]|uniref:Putative T-cell immunomodulatory protein n=1 Tax=Neospora caninum (strain Liverpool) TaxID=572307 RepID=F0V9X0_NEOCL|nr:putative T-cell immunomodulatory protein [Neospora caninum Liverpool]CBZ50732.1 putative T-cell immunomodulatory protein [Neospora caninum Liverpool]|eukprot:XP_003880765.1 putative T-cell immunomodulatory protein [Neospora caninum Liverpool]
MRSRRRAGGGEEADGRVPQSARRSLCSPSRPSPLPASPFPALAKKDAIFCPSVAVGDVAMTARLSPVAPTAHSFASSRSSSAFRCATSPGLGPASPASSPSLSSLPSSSSVSFVSPSSSAATPPLGALPGAETGVSRIASGPAEGDGGVGFSTREKMDGGRERGALEVGERPKLPPLHLLVAPNNSVSGQAAAGARGAEAQSSSRGTRLRTHRSFALFLIVLLSIVLFISFVITPFSSFLIDLSLQRQTPLSSFFPRFPRGQGPPEGSPASLAPSLSSLERRGTASSSRASGGERDGEPRGSVVARLPLSPPKSPAQLRLEQARARGHSAAAAFPDEIASEDRSKALPPGNASLSSAVFSHFGSLSIFPSLSPPRASENAADQKRPLKPSEGVGTRDYGGSTAPVPSPPTAVGGGAGVGASNLDAASRPLLTPFRPVGWGAERKGTAGAPSLQGREAGAPSASRDARGPEGDTFARGSSPAGLSPSTGGAPRKWTVGQQDGWRGELAEFADYNGDSHADMIFISRSSSDNRRNPSLPALSSLSPSPLSASSGSRSTPRSTAFASVYTWDAGAGVFAFFTKAEVPESTESLIALDWNEDGRADLLAVCTVEPRAVAEARLEAKRLFQRLQEEEESTGDETGEGRARQGEKKREEKGKVVKNGEANTGEGERKNIDAGASSGPSFFRSWFESPTDERGERREDSGEEGEGKNYYLVAYVQRSDGKLEKAWDSITGVDRLLERLERQWTARRRMARAIEDRERRRREARSQRGTQTRMQRLTVSVDLSAPQTPGEDEKRGEQAEAAGATPALPRRRLAEKEWEGMTTALPGRNGNQTTDLRKSASLTRSHAPSSHPPRRSTDRNTSPDLPSVSSVSEAMNTAVERTGDMEEAERKEDKGEKEKEKSSENAGEPKGGRGNDEPLASSSGVQDDERERKDGENFASGTVNAAGGEEEDEEEDTSYDDSLSFFEDGIVIQGVRAWSRFERRPEALSVSLSEERRAYLENLALLPLLRFSSIHPLVADVTMDGRPDLIAQTPLLQSPSPFSSSPPRSYSSSSPSTRVRRFVWIACSREEEATARASSRKVSGSPRRLPASEETEMREVKSGKAAKEENEETGPESREARERGALEAGSEARREREGTDRGYRRYPSNEDDEINRGESRRQQAEQVPFQPMLWQRLDKWIANAGEAEEKNLVGKIVSPHSSAFLDLDGDCRPDLVFQVEFSSPPPPASSFLSPASAAASSSASASSSSRYLEVWVSRFDAQEGRARYTLGHDTAFVPLPRNVRQISFADFNADGTLDLVMPTCVTSEECNECCVEADRIVFAPNRQPGLCPSLWSFSNPNRAPCKAAYNLCSLSDFFSIPPLNEAAGDFTVVNIDSDPHVHFYGDQDHPPTLRVGDWNGDGYPDLAFVAVRNGGYRTARLYYNVPAEGKSDSSLRTFELAHDITPDEGGDGVSLLFDQMAFFDLFEDGSLDVFCMGQPQPPSASSSPFTSSRAFLRTLDSDSRFLKVTALSGMFLF